MLNHVLRIFFSGCPAKVARGDATKMAISASMSGERARCRSRTAHPFANESGDALFFTFLAFFVDLGVAVHISDEWPQDAIIASVL